jgi:hypothetical protein
MSQIVQLRPFLLRSAHLQLLVEAMELVRLALDEAAIQRAAARFLGTAMADRDHIEAVADHQDAWTQLLPWLLWDVDVDGRGPVGVRLLETPRPKLQRQVLTAVLAAEVDVWQVLDLTPDRAVVRRLRDGHQTAVAEPMLPAVATVGDVFVARLVTVGDTVLMDAVHACLPALARRGMLLAARRAVDLPRPERLPHLLRAAGRALRRALPTLEPWREEGNLQVVRHVYAIDDAVRLDGAIAALVAAGRLTVRSSNQWLIADAELGPVGATLRRAAHRLHASTSRQRAEVLQATVRQCLPGLRALPSVVGDLTAILDDHQGQARRSASVRTMARDWLGDCLASFHDTAHLWLGGLTPREAVRTPVGRDQVRAWLRVVEQVSEVAGPAWESQVRTIWRDLASS